MPSALSDMIEMCNSNVRSKKGTKSNFCVTYVALVPVLPS
jgi:hypothetical protein